MKKLLFLFVFTVAVMFAANAQSTMTTTGNVDSSATEYISAQIGGGMGLATIQVSLIKVANSGSTVAGYCILQGSNDGVSYNNCPTWKSTNYGSTPGNTFAIDTFTLANVTTAQPYTWYPTTYGGTYHPYLYYRVKMVITTCTLTPSGYYIFRKQN